LHDCINTHQTNTQASFSPHLTLLAVLVMRAKARQTRPANDVKFYTAWRNDILAV